MQSGKLTRSLAVCAFAAAMMAQAQAVTVSRADGQPINPNGEPFSAQGMMNHTKYTVVASCNTWLNGTVTATGVVTITSVTITGSSACKLLQPTATSVTPWTGQFDSPTQLTINNMAIDWQVLGPCGPSKVTAQWANTLPGGSTQSGLTLNNAVLAPNCSATGGLVTSPKLQVD
jgi:hypothetical protein